MFLRSLIALVILGVVGCGDASRRAEFEPKVETLELRKGGTGGVQVTIPAEFVVEYIPEADFDKYYIYDPADDTQPADGLVVVDVAPQFVPLIPDSAKAETDEVTFPGGRRAMWRSRSVEEEGAPELHHWESVIDDPALPAGTRIRVLMVGTNGDLLEEIANVIDPHVAPAAATPVVGTE